MDGLHAIHIVASCIAGLFAGTAFHSRSDVTLIAFTAPPLRLMAVRLLSCLLIARVTSLLMHFQRFAIMSRDSTLAPLRAFVRLVGIAPTTSCVDPCASALSSLSYCRYLIGLSYTLTMQFVVSSLPFTNSQS